MTTDLRCTACGSLVRPGAGWCSLCHEDLRSEEEKAAARAAARPWEADVEGEAGRPETDDEPGTEPQEGPAAPGPVTVQAGQGGRHRRPAQTPGGGTATALRPGPLPMAASPVAAPDPSTPGPVDAVLAEAGIDVEGMLELLAANESRPLESLRTRLADRTTRVVTVLAAVGVLTGLSLIAMFVLGSLMH